MENTCDKCKQKITGGFVEDDNGNEAEIEKGHDDDCPTINN